MLKLAPTLIVDKVEPSLEFWTKRLGFTKVNEVPGKDGLVFAMLEHSGIEIHLQSRASAVKDMPFFAGSKMPSSNFLYFDVKDVRALYERLKGVDIVVPLEKTFYGATHFFLKEPGGHVVGFSENG